MFKKILCPLDGSDHSRKALAKAIGLAARHDAQLLLVQVLLRNANAAELGRFAENEGLAEHLSPEVQRLRAMGARVDVGYSTYDESRASSRVLVEVGQHLLDDAKSDAEEAGVRKVDTVLVDGDPADAILRCIEEHGVDCVVMGGRGLSGIKAFFLGSVSHKVANHASCTCMIVKQ